MPTADFRPQTCLSPGSCWRLHRWVKLGQVPGHLAHEPFEALAVEVVAELLLSRDVPCRKVPVLRPALVDVLCVLIHPHLGHPLQVLWGQQPWGKTKGKKKKTRSEISVQTINISIQNSSPVFAQEGFSFTSTLSLQL